MNSPLHAFTGYGIELEYMIVDRHSLSVRPLADRLLGEDGEVSRGAIDWSNELVLHLLELKNHLPGTDLHGIKKAFQAEVDTINRRLAGEDARLMPGAMHPWMNPRQETHLWPHAHAAIYQAYDRIFDCREGHGWANLQSMHLNLPFAGDDEFARLHAAVRLVLPILPALAASSPIAEGKAAGWLDYRMQAYATNSLRVPSLLGQVVPENIASRAEYEERILAPIYRDIAPHDPEGVLRQDWLNSRGAIPRFGRSAIEVRVIDVQECPQADITIAAAVIELVRAVYQGRWASLAEQQAIGGEPLLAILRACSRDAEAALIDHAGYLHRLGFPGTRCQAGELWAYLLEGLALDACWRASLAQILRHGTLARRILRAVGDDPPPARLHEVYGNLCECLAQGRLFL